MINPLAPRDGLRIKNDNASSIPPRSVVMVTSVETTTDTATQESSTFYHINQYDGSPGKTILVTSSVTIAAGGYGTGYSDDVVYVSIDGSLADPVVAENWGPAPGQWTMVRGSIGFVCIGYSNNGGTPKRAIFKRETGQVLIGKVVTSSISAGSLSSPTNFTADVWLPSGSTAGTGFARATQSGFQGVTIYNYDPSMTGKTGYTCHFKPWGNRYICTWLGCST